MSGKSQFGMWRGCLLAALIALILRKFYHGHVAMNYVWEYRAQVSHQAMLASDAFTDVIKSIDPKQPSLIMILNRHALNMTLNWLCNTLEIRGVHSSLLVVTLDFEADRELALLWPTVRRLRWKAPSLEEPFNYGDGRYQLFYLFRANLALALLRLGKRFWMVQQDTFWRDSLLDENLLHDFSGDVLFDRADNDPEGRLIAGGYYFARPTPGAIRYFERLSGDLETLYVPDNTAMTALCEEPGVATCDHVPFSVITNWIWLYEPSRRSAHSTPPALIQFDGDTRLGGKLHTMRQLGFYFLNATISTHYHCSCNATAVETARLRIAGLGSSAVGESSTKAGELPLKRWSHWQFGIYQWLIDALNRCSLTKSFLNSVIFPRAHYFMITL